MLPAETLIKTDVCFTLKLLLEALPSAGDQSNSIEAFQADGQHSHRFE